MKIEIPQFENVRVLVVGDVMLDQYWHGNASRISPEAPVPVVQIDELEERPGGAANVAFNISALGCKVDLLGILGEDRAGELLKEKLKIPNVNCHFHTFSDVSTISKLRVIGQNQQLIRLDFEQKFTLSHSESLIDNYTQLLSEVDIVVLSDYGKGTLTQVKTLINSARQLGIPILVDPKSNDFGKYEGATLITPNLKEFEAVVGPCFSNSDIENRGFPLLNAYQFEAILVTRSEEGMTLLQREHNPLHLPTRAREVYDVSGAGDTVISVLAASLAAGLTFDAAAMLANTAAGVVVQKLGTAAVSLSELRRAWQRQHDSEMGILTEEQLVVAIADARAHGETIVMTNGCFDILHTGHVTYLEQAKELGHRLIVAVNDDHSVTRLKGSARPINSLRDRMMVLAALRAVDWVVSFSEDTPERIIKRLSPDVLVKGGDYRIKDIAGSDFILSKGGQVKVLRFVEGYSTSSLIKKTKESLLEENSL